MESIIKYLKERRSSLLMEIKSGDNTKIKDKIETDTAVAWLEKINESGLEHPKEYDFIKLPDMKTGYSEYHIMNDCESGDVNNWIELKDETGYPVTLIFDDILISRKPK